MELGELYMTAGVNDLVAEDEEFAQHIAKSMARYLEQDWGDLTTEDVEMNNLAVASGEDRILAAYKHPQHPDWRIWIITEWDRSATTILFPDEY